MAKMNLPTLNARTRPNADATTTPTQAIQAEPGPVFVTPAVDPDAEADAQRDRSVDIGDEAVEGMTAEIVTSAEQQEALERQHKMAASTDVTKMAVDMPRWGTPPQAPLAPRLAAEDIAKLEELSRSLLEVRSIAVAAQTTMQGIQKDLSYLAAIVSRGEAQTTEQIADLWKFITTDHKHSLGLDDEVAMLRSRLDAADALLSSRGLPTTAAVATKPTLKLHARRRIVHAATLEGDAVVLYYNPRQGHDGNDNQEFQLSKDNARNVWSGYQIEVPPGYVADVFVDGDVITSKQGHGDAEFILKMVTRGPNRTISSGNEICRLTLRKIEAMRLEVVQS